MEDEDLDRICPLDPGLMQIDRKSQEIKDEWKYH